MYPMKSQQASRNMPPLPPATLVIDMRGEGEDVIGMLEIEIRNLTEEMRQQNIRLWSSLTDFIAFRAMEPLGDDEIAKMHEPTPQEQQQTSSSLFSGAKARPRSQSLTGAADQLDASNSFPPQYQASNLDESEDEQDVVTTPYADFADLVEEIDRLRNIRINAVSNLGTDGTVGRNVKEPGVRVIFLADARHANSLVSTASCAAYLKKYYQRLERNNEQAGQQIPVNISVLCLNHQNIDQSIAPTRLIQGLRWENSWDHLDALILSEKYRQDIGRMDNDTQNLLAELLLYVLLIVSPALARIRPSAPRILDEGEDKADEERISLPPNTFLVGLSSIENSTRWGYQLLNCGLAEQAIYVLLDGNQSNEQALAGPAVENWLNELRGHVRSAIPNHMPREVPAIHAITLAEKAATPPRGIFSTSKLSLNLGERSISELEQYLTTVTATYHNNGTTSAKAAAGTASSAPSTLQDAMQSVPTIEQMIDQLDGSEPETPLILAQRDAYRALSHPRLFQGPRGALPRAKVQLRELANATAVLQSTLQQNPIKVHEQQKTLQESGKKRIDELRNHTQKWPFFASFLNLKAPMIWITMALLLFFCFTFALLGFAWLGQAIATLTPAVFSWLNTPLFGITAFNSAYLLLVLVLLICLVLIIFGAGRSLFRKDRTPLSIEIIFGCALLVTLLTGLLVWWSSGFVDTSLGLNLLSWYPPTLRAWVSSLAFLLLLILSIGEFFYYSWWRKELELERDEIARHIKAEHLANIEDMVSHIVNKLLLRLLENAGLSDQQTSNGIYYRRVDELSRLLTSTYTYTKEGRRLAEGRLGSNLGDASLRIRQELLDVAALKRGYKRLGAAMVQQKNELRELAEVLLRSLGKEMPHQIERQLREKAPPTDREAYYTQILVEALTAVALRFSTAMPASDMLTALEERYNELDVQSNNRMSTSRLLVDALNKKMKSADLDEDENSNEAIHTKMVDVPLAAQALAAWSQLLWEKKDPELAQVLAPGGVIAKLVSKGYSSQTIKETLGMRTSPSGRSLITRVHDELYVFVSPSQESRKFMRDFLHERYISDFPDSERLLLMHIQHYIARPIFVPRAELAAGPQPAVVDSTPSAETADHSTGNMGNTGMPTVNAIAPTIQGQ